MGEAKRRGTYKERVAEALKAAALRAEEARRRQLEADREADRLEAAMTPEERRDRNDRRMKLATLAVAADAWLGPYREVFEYQKFPR